MILTLPLKRRQLMSNKTEEERCCKCDEPTGRAGEGDDSMYREDGTGHAPDHSEKLNMLLLSIEELLEVAYLRGDNDVPLPENDPRLWSVRMQTAWDEMERALYALNPKSEDNIQSGITSSRELEH